MSDLVNVLPVLGALVLAGILLGSAKPAPVPVPVKSKKHRR
ncbi:MAG: hypothetical protein ACOZQL_34885 [Myxococcota bacterium]